MTVIFLEANPNKHIHIPEYILMTWLVFEALRRDYKGGGIFLLVFILSSLPGILDEVLQGLHPGRSYGWQDMSHQGRGCRFDFLPVHQYCLVFRSRSYVKMHQR